MSKNEKDVEDCLTPFISRWFSYVLYSFCWNNVYDKIWYTYYRKNTVRLKWHYALFKINGMCAKLKVKLQVYFVTIGLVSSWILFSKL